MKRTAYRRWGALALVLCLLLAGCSPTAQQPGQKPEQEPPEQTDSPQADKPEQQSEAEPEPEPEPAPEPEPEVEEARVTLVAVGDNLLQIGRAHV